MSGDISRDFAASLSKLHYEVDTLKKQNLQLTAIVEELIGKVDKTEINETRKQRARVLRAAASQNVEEIDALSSQTTDIAEQELLRMFRPQEIGTQVEIKVNPQLLENFRQAGAKPPTTHEQPKVIPFIETAAYRDQVQRQIQQEAEKSMAQYHSRQQQIKQAREHESRNIMKRLSPLWKTDSD